MIVKTSLGLRLAKNHMLATSGKGSMKEIRLSWTDAESDGVESVLWVFYLDPSLYEFIEKKHVFPPWFN